MSGEPNGAAKIGDASANTRRSPPECRIRMLIQFTLAKAHDRDAAAFTCFASNLAKELSFGRMHQSV